MDCLRCVVEPGEPATKFAFTESSVLLELDRNLAVARYSLTYQSSSATDTRHVSFTFPQDDSSALFEFEATVNDRVIRCEVRDKQEARETFEKAVEAGFSAAMAGESDTTSDLFNCYLGNVRAGSAVRIRMGFLIELDEAEPGLCRLTLMRRLVPRYSPGQVGTCQVLEVVEPSQWLSGKLEIVCQLPSEPAVAAVECGQAGVEWVEAGRRFRLTGAEASGTADLEILLRYAEPSGPLPQLLVSRQAASAPSSVFRGCVLACELMLGEQLMLQQPAAKDKEFVLIVDRSGSMSGSNINSAREALLLFLKSLPADCHFNVVSFGSDFTSLFPTSQPYSETTLAAALSLQSTMEADMGGTEILQPLEWLFGQASPCGSRSAVLITDGEVSNVQEVKDLVHRSCSSGSTRVHAVGIGHGASTALVKGIARVGRGRAEFVRDNDASQLRRTVVGLLKTDRLETIDSLHLEVTQSGQPVTFRTVPEGLSGGLPSLLRVRVFVLLDSEPPADLAVRAQLSVGGRQVQLDCGKVRQSSADCPVYQLAAARHLIKEWTDENEDDGRTEAIKELSKATNLSSPYTTFVGVDRTPGKPVDPSKPAAEPQELPGVVCFEPPMNYAYQYRTMACHFSGAPIAMACMAMPRMVMCAESLQESQDLEFIKMDAEEDDGLACSELAGSASLELLGETGALAADPSGPQSPPQPPPPPPLPTTDEARTLRIAQLQAFDGHWAPTADLLAVLGMPEGRLRESLPSGLSEEAWTTVLVLSYLESRLSRHKAEWELLAEKSRSFLASGQRCGGRALQELLALALAALN